MQDSSFIIHHSSFHLMLYYILRFLVRISLHFYCKRIGWEGVENIPKGKPILFAITHSNSFFDSLFVASPLRQSAYCLVRGDVYRNPLVNRILRHLRSLPIHRQSEKDENMADKNEQTFAECQELFRQNQWALIFPEGICLHQTEVLPLKKGASLMAQRAWAEGIDLQIIPVSISYDSLTKWGKKCDVIFQKPIQNTDIQPDTSVNQTIELNTILHKNLSDNFPSPFQFQGKRLLWGWFGQFLYYAGWVVHFPLYFICHYLGNRFSKGTIFYDSVVIGLLSILLPFYYLLVWIIFHFLK